MEKLVRGILVALLSIATTSSALADEADVQNIDFKYPTAAEYPKVPSVGSKLSDFVPKGWKILAQATGDLNRDNNPDAAIVVQNTEAKYIQKNKGLGSDIFDSNLRMLIVVFKDPVKNKYNLAEQGNTIIPVADSPTMCEPFETIAIKERLIHLGTTVFFSAGSWFTSNSIYKFKYLNNKFYLVGAEVTEFQRNSGEETQLSYNFYTNKLKTVTSSGGEEDIKGKVLSKKDVTVKWTNLPRHHLKAMSTFKRIGEWNIVGDHNL